MPTLEERVAYLEGRGEEHDRAMTDVRTDIRELRAEIREDIRDLRAEVRDVRSEMTDVRGEMTGLRSEMNRRFETVDAKFIWVIGLQFATILTVVAALANTYFR